MTTNIDHFSGGIDPEERTWKPANPRRGAGYRDIALRFVRDYPVGSTLQAEKFDRWAHENGFLVVPFDAPRQSDPWKAHLMRRHELKKNLITAGAHPRMSSLNSQPFTITVVGNGIWAVRSPEGGILDDKTPRKVQTLVRTRRRQLTRLLESANWAILPPYERALAEAIYADIEMFQRRVDLEADGLDGKFRQLERKIRLAVQMGELVPTQGDLLALFEHEEGDEAEAEEGN